MMQKTKTTSYSQGHSQGLFIKDVLFHFALLHVKCVHVYFCQDK